MEKRSVPGVACCAALALLLGSCQAAKTAPQGSAENRIAAAHSREFEKKIHRVTDGVYAAVGYGIANAIMLVGKDGVVIVDTMTSVEEGRAVWKDLRTLTPLPLKAIVYTHSHPDHVLGASAFAGEAAPEIYAHEGLDHAFGRAAGETAPIVGSRSMRMYGSLLDDQFMGHVGIGPFMGLGPRSTLGYRKPTRTFRDRLSVSTAGISFELIHAPGETDDHIYVWIPDKKVLLCGDNLYRSFPNLYTIRGTSFRSLKNWYRSVDIIRALRPAYLVPSHGRPIAGAEAIYRIATDYRDAIQFVHDQSIRGINQGMTPDELAEYVVLPPHLAGSPYLQEVYGKVSWSARAMHGGALGWFSGDAAHLQPMPVKEQARMMADMAGGEAGLLAHARRYAQTGHPQAALELSGHALRLDPGNAEARAIRIRALTVLGERESNANARHYYLTEALEIRDRFVAESPLHPTPDMVRAMPLSFFFDRLAVNLDPQASAHMDRRVGIAFTDTGEAFTIHVRRGVAEIMPRLADDLHILVRADSVRWKEMAGRLRSPVTTLAGFDYPKGSAVAFALFLKLFEPPPIRLPFENKDE
ncbi:MAG: alkyl sulfatase dimerization domain-containing protein [Thermodesulfobacteriota bacterium]